MKSAYEAFQEGIPPPRAARTRTPRWSLLERARDLEPDKGSVRETLARAYFRTGRFRRGRDGVRAGGGDRPGERLRALRARAVPAPSRVTGSARAGHLKLAVAMRPDNEHYRRALARVDDESA